MIRCESCYELVMDGTLYPNGMCNLCFWEWQEEIAAEWLWENGFDKPIPAASALHISRMDTRFVRHSPVGGDDFAPPPDDPNDIPF